VSSPRGLANHALYLARIQLAAWRTDIDKEVIPASTLAQAFAPAVCEHLRQAYGWFLLTLIGHGDTTGVPPRCCGELPAIAQGKALPGEIHEFVQLEQDGWLADLLAFNMTPPMQSRSLTGSRSNLAVATPAYPSLTDVTLYADQLDAHMARMSNSLDEY
jgi:hypothetical protein